MSLNIWLQLYIVRSQIVSDQAYSTWIILSRIIESISLYAHKEKHSDKKMSTIKIIRIVRLLPHFKTLQQFLKFIRHWSHWNHFRKLMKSYAVCVYWGTEYLHTEQTVPWQPREMWTMPAISQIFHMIVASVAGGCCDRQCQTLQSYQEELEWLGYRHWSQVQW